MYTLAVLDSVRGKQRAFFLLAGFWLTGLCCHVLLQILSVYHIGSLGGTRDL